MSLFGLDPQSIATRARGQGNCRVPTLGGSLLRGTLGFTMVSLAGFAPWALAGGWFRQMFGRTSGEIAMYVACAAAFIALTGLLLHQLIIGPGSLGRFYKVFGLAFTANSVLWIAGWMMLRGHPGSIVGLFAGACGMGAILAAAFEAGPGAALKVIAVIFVLNTLGYFAGGWSEGSLFRLKELNLLGIEFDKGARARLAMLSWGFFYGLGLGAGLGLAFYICQARARALLAGPATHEQAH